MIKFSPETNEKNAVSKAFLIIGGSEEERKEKYLQLYHSEQLLMCCDYQGDNALAIIFSANHRAFDAMNFQKAAEIAGTKELPADFKTSTFGSEERFGIIKLPSQIKNTVTAPKRLSQ